ncbi:MAG: hypothetical protein QF878_03165 [SAR202 cluster bacterium]|nr:hypothetical protein [SAR202 cluster bacterium]
MTQQQLQSQRRASLTIQPPSKNPVFFQSGDLLTWGQAGYRTQLNQTIARMTTTTKSR